MFTQVQALLDGGKTLHHVHVFTDEHVSSTELTYLEIVRCVVTLGLRE